MAAKRVDGGSEMPEQKSRTFENRMSTGNLINIAIVIAGFAAQWGFMQSQVNDMRESFDKRIEKLEEGSEELFAERMREARDIAEMKANMHWIRNTLERLEQDLKRRQ
jgi:hypothetical protein